MAECGPLSARYRCVDCGEGRMLSNVRELKAHTGPAFLRWRRGVAAGVGAILLDDTDRDEHTAPVAIQPLDVAGGADATAGSS